MQGQPITVYGDDIEPYFGRRGDDLCVVGGDPAQGGPLAAVDGGQRRPETARIPPFDLDDHQRRAVEADRIDLPAGKPHVAGEDAVAVARQKRGR